MSSASQIRLAPKHLAMRVWDQSLVLYRLSINELVRFSVIDIGDRSLFAFSLLSFLGFDLYRIASLCHHRDS